MIGRVQLNERDSSSMKLKGLMIILENQRYSYFKSSFFSATNRDAPDLQNALLTSTKIYQN